MARPSAPGASDRTARKVATVTASVPVMAVAALQIERADVLSQNHIVGQIGNELAQMIQIALRYRVLDVVPALRPTFG